MTGRERVLSALNLKEPDRIPTLEWAISKNVIESIAGYDSLERFVCDYDIDGIAVSIDYRRETVDEKHFRDEWKTIRISYGEYPVPIAHPIATMEDFKAYKFPDPDDEFRYRTISRVQKEMGNEKAVIARVKDVFSIPRDLMGFETFLTGFYLEPELVDALIAMSVENSIRIAKNLRELGIDIAVLGDDIANNTGMLISPDMYREKVLPHFQKLVTQMKRMGFLIIKHTDGDIRQVMADIIDTGINCIDPIDPLGKMDLEQCKREFGGRVALKGNVDCVHTLVDNPKEDVVSETKRCILSAGIGGGYIISSSNTIHRGVNPENYLCFLEAAKRYGTYPLALEELKS